MNELQDYVNKLNEKISNPEGKIYLDNFKGYTSDLMERLISLGYKPVASGATYILKDSENHEVTTSYSWEDLLYNTAIVIR